MAVADGTIHLTLRCSAQSPACLQSTPTPESQPLWEHGEYPEHRPEACLLFQWLRRASTRFPAHRPSLTAFFLFLWKRLPWATTNVEISKKRALVTHKSVRVHEVVELFLRNVFHCETQSPQSFLCVIVQMLLYCLNPPVIQTWWGQSRHDCWISSLTVHQWSFRRVHNHGHSLSRRIEWKSQEQFVPLLGFVWCGHRDTGSCSFQKDIII